MSKRLALQLKDINKKLKIKNENLTGISSNDLQASNYYYEDGLRKVEPYFYTFRTFAKGRWVGRRLIDVYQNEFRLYSLEEYKSKIRNGHLLVNEKMAELSYIIKPNDTITSKIHRHETPINCHPEINILVNDSNYVVVDKPCSIPIHPCGNFRFNSLLFILAKEHGLTNLYPGYRIDRLTSGLVIFTKNLQSYKIVNSDILNKTANKEYLCLVEGIFNRESVTCDKPIKIFSFKVGISAVSQENVGENDAQAKNCLTRFDRLAILARPDIPPIDSLSERPANFKFYSLLKVTPLTGRTHQIRVHAQYLGYPIVNDPLYNTTYGWGPCKGKGGQYFRPLKNVIEDLIISSSCSSLLPCDSNDQDQDDPQNDVTDRVDNNSSVSDKLPDWYVQDCYDCAIEVERMRNRPHKQVVPDSDEDSSEFSHFIELPMYLHCYKYSGNDWTFQTPLPLWARIPELSSSHETSPSESLADINDGSLISPGVSTTIKNQLTSLPDATHYSEGDPIYIVKDVNVIKLYPKNFNPYIKHVNHKDYCLE